MKRLHLFNPDNDLALAANLANYTPPPAAARLRSAGQTLPLWYGADGDRFVSTGTDARWLDAMREAFGMDVDVFPYRPELFAPEPWGWSAATRSDFLHLGYGADALPSPRAIDAIRLLSHRRTATSLHALLPQQYLTPAAIEVKSVDELDHAMQRLGDAVVKLPWSSSGRGVFGISAAELAARRAAIEGAIRRQGSVMVEPKLDKGTDFAMLFDISGGTATFQGLSLFQSDICTGYAGNILMPQQDMEQTIKASAGTAAFDAVRDAMAPALQKIIGTAYSGPLGIDFFTVGHTGRIALAEINLRRTMGRLCLDFYTRYAAAGTRGHFKISPRTITAAAQATAPPQIFNGRLHSGTLALNPPGAAFNFAVTLR